MQMLGSGGERVWVRVGAGVGAGGCSCPAVLGGNGLFLAFLPGLGT